MVEFREIEYKYEATDVDETAFREETLRVLSNLDIAHTVHEDVACDEFFTCTRSQEGKRGEDSVDVVRYRYNTEFQEVTLKKNTSSTFNRIEINLKVCTDSDTVRQFFSLLGYEYDFTLYKKYIVISTHECDISLYTVYPCDPSVSGVNPIGQFVEIEANHKLANEGQCTAILDAYERHLPFLPGRPRVCESLYAIYKGWTTVAT